MTFQAHIRGIGRWCCRAERAGEALRHRVKEKSNLIRNRQRSKKLSSNLILRGCNHLLTDARLAKRIQGLLKRVLERLLRSLVLERKRYLRKLGWSKWSNQSYLQLFKRKQVEIRYFQLLRIRKNRSQHLLLTGKHPLSKWNRLRHQYFSLKNRFQTVSLIIKTQEIQIKQCLQLWILHQITSLSWLQ
jgi:hypothetical protein